MPEYAIYKLHFTTPVHFGDNREDYDISLRTIQSDTLYAALTACLAKTGNIIPVNGDLGFVVSSLFPFYQKDPDSEAVYFLPKPLRQIMPKVEESGEIKAIKKIAWLDIDCFQEILRGNHDVYLKSAKGSYLTERNLSKNNSEFIRSQVSPRVVVSRSGEEDARPFYMDRVEFEDYSGLYFMVTGNTKLLDKAMNVLQHEGIGTDRNVGNGFFEYSKDTIIIDHPQESDYALSLSMFIPENQGQLEEMTQGDSIAYDFARRGGWLTTPPYNTIRKNTIYAFLPGSVFSVKDGDKNVRGRIVDLRPELSSPSIPHPVWRNGKSLFIPIKI